MSARLAVCLAAIALLSACVAPPPPHQRANAQLVANARALASPPEAWTTVCEDWDEWEKAAPPFRIHGDSYHVGTCGITAILLAGAEGHVLIDTGTRNGSRSVLDNIRLLGLVPVNVQAILTSHEHFDHVGGLHWVQSNSGATIYTSATAEPVIVSGTISAADPQFGMHPPMHGVDSRWVRTVTPGEPLNVAGHTLTPIATPGHTPGALSWLWQSCEGDDCVTIVYADSLSPISADDYRFSDHPEYVEAFRTSLTRLAALDCDILLTPHPSASSMRDKLVSGDLRSGMGCADYAAGIARRLDDRLAREAEPSVTP